MNRHPLDLFQLLSGSVLTAIALAALFGVTTRVAAWVWPTVLVTLGVAVVAVAVGGGRDRVSDTAVDTAPDADRVDALAAARAEVDEADHATE